VPAVSERRPIAEAYCVTGRNIYRPGKIESCAGMANPQKQT
jgi:hypothetical protein